MFQMKTYQYVRIISVVCILAVLLEYWRYNFIGLIVLLIPYVTVFALANNSAYKTRLAKGCRMTGAVLIAAITVGILFGIKSDPQAGIGVLFAAMLQYGILFISEAILGLVRNEA